MVYCLCKLGEGLCLQENLLFYGYAIFHLEMSTFRLVCTSGGGDDAIWHTNGIGGQVYTQHHTESTVVVPCHMYVFDHVNACLNFLACLRS